MYLCKREPFRVPRKEALARRPLCDRLVDNALIAKGDDLKFSKSQHTLHDGSHGARLGLLIHGANADANFGQLQLFIRNLRLLHILTASKVWQR